jgi:serine/threonine-protein kinase
VRPPRPARRRPTTTIAIAAVAVLLGLAGLGTALLLRPDSSEAQLPPAGAGPTTGAADPPAATTKPAKPRATRRSSPARTTAPGTPAAASSAPSAGADLPATNPHSARELCGPGHRVIDAAPLRDGGTLLGRVQLLRAPGGATCVVTLKATDLGQATEASAFLEVRGADRDDDGGAVDYYAGPVRAAAPGACVRWGGSIGGQRVDSDFEHCD